MFGASTRISDTSTYFRFFGIRREIPEVELRNAVDPEVVEHVTLLASVDGQLAGIGEFIVGSRSDEAEVAFLQLPTTIITRASRRCCSNRWSSSHVAAESRL